MLGGLVHQNIRWSQVVSRIGLSSDAWCTQCSFGVWVRSRSPVVPCCKRNMPLDWWMLRLIPQWYEWFHGGNPSLNLQVYPWCRRFSYDGGCIFPIQCGPGHLRYFWDHGGHPGGKLLKSLPMPEKPTLYKVDTCADLGSGHVGLCIHPPRRCWLKGRGYIGEKGWTTECSRTRRTACKYSDVAHFV